MVYWYVYARRILQFHGVDSPEEISHLLHTFDQLLSAQNGQAGAISFVVRCMAEARQSETEDFPQLGEYAVDILQTYSKKVTREIFWQVPQLPIPRCFTIAQILSDIRLYHSAHDDQDTIAALKYTRGALDGIRKRGRLDEYAHQGLIDPKKGLKLPPRRQYYEDFEPSYEMPEPDDIEKEIDEEEDQFFHQQTEDWDLPY